MLTANAAKDAKWREVWENLTQVGIVAFTFVIVTQYWQVREHAVFLLLFVYAIATFFYSNQTIRLERTRLLTLGFFAIFLLWLLVSALWSPTLHLSFAYGLLTILVGISAVFHGLMLNIRNFASGLVLGTTLQVAHSIFLYLSQIGDGSGNLWGLYTNRSSLTLVIGIALVVLPFAVKRYWVSWIAFGSVFTILFFYLIQLRILTSFFALCGALVLALVLLHLRSHSRRARAFFAGSYAVIAVAGISVFWFFRGPILSLIGEDASLGERVPLWGLYFEAILWRPILGSGWGSTVGWDFPLSPDRLSPVAEWFPAHNGYLDIALMLGFVGLGLFLTFLASLLLVSLRDASDGEVQTSAIVIPVLLMYLMINDVMATSFPKLVGIYLVGTLLGLAVARTSSIGGNFGVTGGPSSPDTRRHSLSDIGLH